MNAANNIYLYDTMTRSLRAFSPGEPGVASVYTCGPTVYNFAHLGNMRTYLFSDILTKTLRLSGLRVNHVMNITDVGHLVSDGDEGPDKMSVGADRENLTASQLADKYTKAFFESARLLNISTPDTVCRATDHIAEQVDMALRLERRGYTYQTADGLYFDTAKFLQYGELARIDVAGLKAGSRVRIGQKRHKTDFAIWKLSKPGEHRQMEWDSPWGRGFPGWHLECSAMSTHYLGDSLDIHTGGIDHIPVHHTNEIAQSECATGARPFAKLWMHSNFLQLTGEERMAKSKGNILTVERLSEAGFDPLAFRYLCLGAHYRAELKFSFSILEGAAAAYRRLTADAQTIGAQAERPDAVAAAPAALEITEALFDDLSTPAALVKFRRALSDDDLSPEAKRSLIETFDQVFSLDLLAAKPRLEAPDEVWRLVRARNASRVAKDWREADRLRRLIEDLGYALEDGPGGTRVTSR